MMNDAVIKLCVYWCSDYVFSCKQLPLILMKRKVLGHKFSRKEAQKVAYFPQSRLVFDLGSFFCFLGN